MNIRGALHLHSNASYDAKLPLSELRRLFLQHGLHFALMTEHTDRLSPLRAEQFIEACDGESDEHFLFIPGFEVPYKDSHVLMIGARAFISQRGETTLQAWKQAAHLAVLAHPHRNHYEVDEIMREVLDGVEIWNSQYDGKFIPRTRSRKLFSYLRQRTPQLYAFSGWDLHRTEHAGGPTIVLAAPALTADVILGELAAGRFSSVSPSVEIDSAGNIVRGESSFLFVRSSFFVISIAFLKFANRVLAGLHLRPPKRLREYIRRWL